MPQPVTIGQKLRMPEFSLAGKVVCVSGAGWGLGLTQSEALLKADAKVYALGRLEEPGPDFAQIQQKAKELGTELHLPLHIKTYRSGYIVIPGSNTLAKLRGELDKRPLAERVVRGDPDAHHSAWGGVGMKIDNEAEQLLEIMDEYDLEVITEVGKQPFELETISLQSSICY